MNRMDALKELAFEKKNLDGFLVTNETNMLYLTGTPGASCLLIPKRGESTIYVYGVNYEQTKAEAKGSRVELLKRGEKLNEKLSVDFKALKITKLAVDTIGYDLYRLLAKVIRGKAKMNVQGNLVWDLRKVKDKKEIELMRKAGELTIVGMKAANKAIRQGVTEIEVAAEIEYAMRKGGGHGAAFGSIVASGVRSAYPHGGCENRKIREDDLVVVDIGSACEHYCSDMTRTFVAGKPSAKQQKLYDVVLRAQDKAYHAIRAKAKGKHVDEVARKVIEDAGYSEYFVHGLGHGVGLEIHEPPVLASISKDRLAVGNVVTDEPGIYFPGYGGIRIEDTVLVGERKSEKLTDGFYSLEVGQ